MRTNIYINAWFVGYLIRNADLLEVTGYENKNNTTDPQLSGAFHPLPQCAEKDAYNK